jgi:hypothetical protein
VRTRPAEKQQRSKPRKQSGQVQQAKQARKTVSNKHGHTFLWTVLVRHNIRSRFRNELVAPARLIFVFLRALFKEISRFLHDVCLWIEIPHVPSSCCRSRSNLALRSTSLHSPIHIESMELEWTSLNCLQLRLPGGNSRIIHSISWFCGVTNINFFWAVRLSVFL